MNVLHILKLEAQRYEDALMEIAWNCTTLEEAERVAKAALSIDVDTSEEQLDLWND